MRLEQEWTNNIASWLDSVALFPGQLRVVVGVGAVGDLGAILLRRLSGQRVAARLHRHHRISGGVPGVDVDGVNRV